MEWNDQIRGVQTIDEVHVLSEDGRRGWDDHMRGLQSIR